MTSLSPFIRTPFTDLTGSIISHQLLGKCAKQEELAMDCMEAYGATKGQEICKPYIDNFLECHSNFKQYKRFVAMRKERARQISEGKLTGDNKYVTPRIDSY